VVHHLQQDVEEVGMRLLDLVEQDHRVGMLAHGIHEQAALLEAHVAGGSADEAGHRVLLAVFAHVVADELVPEVEGELLGQLRLAHAGGASEQEAARGMVGMAEPRARALDGHDRGVDGALLPEHHALQRFFQRAQALLVGGGGLFLGDARHAGHDLLDLGHVRRLLLVRAGRLQAQHGPRLVQDVDGAIREPVVAQVPAGEAGGRLQGGVGVGDLVVVLVAAAQPAEDLDRLLQRGLVEVDLLDAPGQGAVLLDVLELLERGRAHEPDLAFGQDGLDQVREVHGAAGGGARADHGVHLVDEEDGPRPLLERVQDGLEALLEVAAITRPREQRPRVEGEDFRSLQDLGGVLLQQAQRQPFHERGLAHSGIAHEDGVVLAPPGQDLQRALQLGHTADEGVELSQAAALGEVHAVRTQGIPRGGGALFAGAPRGDLGLDRFARDLRDPVRDVVEDVEPAHPLAGQEVHGMGASLGQERGQDVPHVRFRLARALHVQNGRLQDATKGQRLVGRALGPERQGLQVLVEERVEVGLDLLGVRAGGAQDLVAARLVDDGEKEVLEGQVGMAPGDGLPGGGVEDALDGAAEHESILTRATMAP
jgi:hypothetical protein